MLKGYDQKTNVVLDESHERVFAADAPVEQVPLGLYLVRGDNMCAAHVVRRACRVRPTIVRAHTKAPFCSLIRRLTPLPPLPSPPFPPPSLRTRVRLGGVQRGDWRD